MGLCLVQNYFFSTFKWILFFLVENREGGHMHNKNYITSDGPHLTHSKLPYDAQENDVAQATPIWCIINREIGGFVYSLSLPFLKDLGKLKLYLKFWKDIKNENQALS